MRNIYWSLCLNKANAYHFDHGSVFGWFYRPVTVNKFQFFWALRFSSDRCTIIINFCYLLLLQKCARLFVFLFRRDHSWTISFSFLSTNESLMTSIFSDYVVHSFISLFHYYRLFFIWTHHMTPNNPHFPTQSYLCKYIKLFLLSTEFYLFFVLNSRVLPT